MGERVPSPQISRRSLLRRGAAVAALATGVPFPSRAAGRLRPAGIGSTSIANVQVSHDHYRVHVTKSCRGRRGSAARDGAAAG
jgi:hypothetical protein